MSYLTNFVALWFKKKKQIPADKISDIGNEYQIKLIPKKYGKIKTKGIRKSHCLTKVNSSAGMDLQIAW